MEHSYFILKTWLILWLLSAILIAIRPDGKAIVSNFVNWFRLNRFNMIVWIIFQLIVVSMPLSIPWSLNKIWKGLWK